MCVCSFHYRTEQAAFVLTYLKDAVGLVQSFKAISVKQRLSLRCCSVSIISKLFFSLDAFTLKLSRTIKRKLYKERVVLRKF